MSVWILISRWVCFYSRELWVYPIFDDCAMGIGPTASWCRSSVQRAGWCRVVSAGVYMCEKYYLNVRQILWLQSDRHKSVSCNVLKPNRLLPLLSFIVNIIVRLTREVAELIFTPVSLPVYKITGKWEDTAISIFSSWKCSSLSSSIYPQLTSYSILYTILCIFNDKMLGWYIAKYSPTTKRSSSGNVYLPPPIRLNPVVSFLI